MSQPTSKTSDRPEDNSLDVDWHQQLKQLVQEVCQHPLNSPQRRKGFNRIIRMIQQSGKLWRAAEPYYEDALQDTWLHFSRNLCEATTAEQPYGAKECFIIARLNAYLKRRLQDYAVQASQEQKQRVLPTQSLEGEGLAPVEQIAAPEETPSVFEEVQEWVEADKSGELGCTHVKGRPDITCQVLILRRLPPETPWKTLAAEFGVSVSTLSGFYEKQCRPRLQQFGQSQGYL
ncbi:sigma-70 family RNA polymerase sigma factor [Trichocoleus sp. FACHB-591]|nr:sigma-70 family RNA polymerase sigma factor [Trichocoleus sp. FACHB-591]